MAPRAPEAKAAPARGGPGRRGRPTADRAAALDSTILAAARATFVDSGYEPATMEAIAERAGVSKGTLYARCQGKEALFRAVVNDRLEHWSVLAGAHDAELPAELGPRLRAHARTLRQMFEWPEYIEVTRLVESAAVTFPDIAKFWQETGTRRFVAFLAREMEAAAGHPPGASPDWTFLANLFLHAIGGWYRAESWSHTIEEAEAAAFADQVIETILTIVAASGDPADERDDLSASDAPSKLRR